MQSTPVFMTLKGQERDQCLSLASTLGAGTKCSLSLKPRPLIDPTDIRSLGRILGLREAVTPATGNCMAMAVAQAFADADLTGGSTNLERMTASIKRGVALAGLLHLEDNYCHDVRVQTFHNVEPGWSHMTRK